MIKLSLKSDFRDYYDVWFNREDETDNIFERYSNSGMNRLGMFGYLRTHGFRVVDYGYVKNFYRLDKDMDVVVYTDINTHRGEGKELMSIKDAMDKYSECLCSKYYKVCDDYDAISSRALQIGDKCISLIYKNNGDWRSNVGQNVDVKIIRVDNNSYNSIFNYIDYPLFAIDFVEDLMGNFLACDFNIAPGLNDVKDVMPGKEVVELIKKRYELNFGFMEE